MMGYVALMVLIVFAAMFLNGYQWLTNRQLKKENEALKNKFDNEKDK